VAQAANANDADAVGRFDIELDKRIEDGGASAKERTGFGRVNAFRDGKSPHGLATDALGEAAGAAHDGLLHLAAKIVVAREAGGASHVAARKPAESDALTDLERFDVRADGGDGADDFVAGDKGVLGPAISVFGHRYVRMTNAAMADGDFDLVGSSFFPLAVAA
jgi:hypothetical protein